MLPEDMHIDSDKMHEECGIVGIWAPHIPDIAKLVYFGLFALQHRGQESAGISVTDGYMLNTYKNMGLVTQIFDEYTLKDLVGIGSVGHVRYSTTGESKLANAQPISKPSKIGHIAIAHNGNLTNTVALRERLSNLGYTFESTADSELSITLIAHKLEEDMNLIDAVSEALSECEGAFSVAVLTNQGLIVARDPHGFRPLVLGQMASDYVVASETCAFDIIGARFVREIKPGELIYINEDGIDSYFYATDKREALCAFEFIYFARPDSVINNKSLYLIRQHLGRLLAKAAPADADLVISVPDSGTPAAIGYSQESGIPFAEGLVKNRYIGRTFIAPSQAMREVGIKMKLNPLKEVINGKRLVVVDDSIVRGSTSKKIATLLYQNGAKEVHFRISSPPIGYPCFFGIDISEQKTLVAANHQSLEAIAKAVGSDSVGYLTREDLTTAINLPKSKLCMACLDGDYPAPLSRDIVENILNIPSFCASLEEELT